MGCFIFWAGPKIKNASQPMCDACVVPVGLEPTTHSLHGRLLLPTERRNLLHT